MTRSSASLAILVGALLAACGGDGGGGGGDEDAGPPPCDYPASSGMLALGETMPPFRWNGVLDADGVASDFDLREFHCSPDYGSYQFMVLVVGAGWCAACPEYLRNTNMVADEIE